MSDIERLSENDEEYGEILSDYGGDDEYEEEEKDKKNTEQIEESKVTLTDKEKLDNVILKNSSVINVPHKLSTFMNFYNFPLSLKEDENVEEDINNIFDNFIALQKNKKAFKMNFSLGAILIHRDTGQYRYFSPGSNNFFFPKPILINRPSHMPKVTEESYNNYMNSSRPNSKWLGVLATNIQIQMYPLNYSMG